MSRRLVLQSVRLVGSCGRPGALPLVPCHLEPRLSASLQLHDLCGARNLLGAFRDPNEVEMHLRLLSVSKGARGALQLRGRRGAKSEMSYGVAVSKPTTSSIPWSSGRRSRSS
jgi:hypothetical protein